MKLSEKFAQFVHNCFNYDYFHKYRFNYGDNNFRPHKILHTPLPEYIQTKYALHTHDWMGYVKILIDQYGNEDWFTVTQTQYGTVHDIYTITEYNSWQDVMNTKARGKPKRVYNSGPNDTPIDVFWLYILDIAVQCQTTPKEIERIFKHTIWFYLCEQPSEAMSRLQCKTTSNICKFYCSK